MKLIELKKRLDGKYRKDAVTGCWLWLGRPNRDGYGTLKIDGKAERAHVVSFVVYKGDVPAGLEIDHLCCVRACIAPYHLEAVTHKENVLRGNSPAALNARKVACKRGHVFTDENTYLKKDGGRQCQTCRRQYREQNRERINRQWNARYHAKKEKDNS